MPPPDFDFEAGVAGTVEEPFVQCDKSVVFIIALGTDVSSIATASSVHTSSRREPGLH